MRKNYIYLTTAVAAAALSMGCASAPQTTQVANAQSDVCGQALQSSRPQWSGSAKTGPIAAGQWRPDLKTQQPSPEYASSSWRPDIAVGRSSAALAASCAAAKHATY